jgi:hypothetical protein
MIYVYTTGSSINDFSDSLYVSPIDNLIVLFACMLSAMWNRDSKPSTIHILYYIYISLSTTCYMMALMNAFLS